MDYPLPTAFMHRMRALLGADAEAFFAAYGREPVTGVRVNLLKLNAEELRRLSPWPLEPVPWCPSGFYLAGDGRPGKHPYHAAGLYYLQEPSAMAVVEVLDVQPGQRVLDLAAAPGGKTTQIAALLRNTGLLVANEVEGSRVKALGENLERWGAHALLTNETPERLADHFGACFDRVLLDAPCSGEGMFRRNAHAVHEWSAEHVAGCALRQAHILEQAARLVAPGGLLGYSTCTFAPEENEQRIAAFLDQHPGWELADIPKQAGWEAAQPEWTGGVARPELARAVRLWPHRIAGEGHFIALLRKGMAAEPAEQPPASVPHGRESRRTRRIDQGARRTWQGVSPQAATAWLEWTHATLEVELPVERLVSKGEQLFLVPEQAPGFGELRVVRPGLWLGTLRPGRFEPAHALALSLHPAEARMVVDLDLETAEHYLRGATLDRVGPNGWVLVTANGWPLGWGRRVSGVVKNFYPKGLRWLG